MKISDFINELEEKEIEISFSGGKLKYKGPEELITPEIIEKLKKHKGKLLKHYWPAEYTNMMPINTEGNKIPLFLVHSDHGNYTISDYFGPNQPVYGFFHPGSDGKRIVYKSIQEMARDYLQQILSLRPSGPYYLSGFSFGGGLAFEMALQLQKLGHKVPFLVLIDAFSPKARKSKIKQKDFFKSLRKDYLGPLKGKLINQMKLFACETFLLLNKPVPMKWRQLYRWETYGSLTKKYKPDHFKGSVLLFRTAQNISSHEYLGWETLVDKINVFTLEASHLTIFKTKSSVDVLQTELDKLLKHVNKINKDK